MLSATRGLAATADSLVVTRGSQMAFDLAARALLSPGDAVAVEELGYSPVWASLTLAGARLIPVPVDAEGVRIDALEKLVSRETLRAIYLTPHHQYPTMAVLSPARRLQLLELARRNRFAILEDDCEFAFDRRSRPNARLAFARQTEAELQDGVRRMAIALRASGTGSARAAPKVV
jgi:GntR family transcriptional regulator/MocR family aminotransferase